MKKYYVTVDEYGNESWHKDAKCKVLHREDGPAIIDLFLNKSWYIDGKLHRIDGPAIENSNNTRAWYINGEFLTEDEFIDRTEPACADKTITIDGVNYKLTKV